MKALTMMALNYAGVNIVGANNVFFDNEGVKLYRR